MALITDIILQQVKSATASANSAPAASSAPSGGGAGTTVYSATAVTFGNSYDTNVYEQVYGQTDQYSGYRSASDAAKDLKDHGEGMYDRRMMDSIHNVKHNVIDNQEWRVDIIEEDKNGDGALDESDAESKALLDAIVDSFDSELDLYIEKKLQEVIDTYGPSCGYCLRSIFGSPNSPAVLELAKLGIRADAVGDHDAWQNRTYALYLVNMEGTEGMSDEEILAHVYAEDAEILQDANGNKGSIIFADCLTADGVAGGAEMNLSSILDQMGYECVSRADFLGNKQGFDDLIANIQTGLDNDLYKGSGQTINDKYGRTLTMAQAVCAVYGINGHAYGNKGWHCKARSFEDTLNKINELGNALYKGGTAVKGAARDFGTGDPMSNISDIEAMSEEYASLMEKMNSEKDPELLKQYEQEAQDLKKKIEEKSTQLSADEEKYVGQQLAKQQEQNFEDAVNEAQKAVDEAFENGEDPKKVIEKIAKEYEIDKKDIEKELKF